MERTISNAGISALTLELSLLLHAGIGVADALALLSEEADYKGLLAGMPENAEGFRRDHGPAVQGEGSGM